MILSTPQSIAERIAAIRSTLPPHVRLMAVTKQVSLAAMREAYEAGIRDFGESRIQEAETKQPAFQDCPDLTWHLIGHLQANKAQRAIALFQWIHSLDSLKLAQRLNQLAAHSSHRVRVCLQVKILPDPNKYGWMIPELVADLAQLNNCTNLEIVGLMTIPPLGLSPIETRTAFEKTQELAQQIQAQQWPNLAINHLSMGMSADYPLAVQAGATIIRLGRVLFGERPPQEPLPETEN